MFRLLLQLVILLLFSTSVVAADEQQQIQAILSSAKPPAGVVFEVVGGDEKTLRAAIDRATVYREKILMRFPAAKFVFISHGLEQFSLLKDRKQDHPELHNKVQSISAEGRMTFEVCGNFADIMDVGHKEFAEFISVVDAAPVQIEAYRLKGYRIIEMQLE